MLPPLSVLTLALAGLLSGCTGSPSPPAPWAAAPTAQPPQWLSEAGVYADLAARRPGSGFIEYTPAFPIWASGAEAHRMIRLPEGATIDNTAETWRFPTGTVVARTFTYDDVEGRRGAVAVETRLIARAATGWVFADYLWNAEGTEARLMGADWPARAVDLSRPKRSHVRHTLPSRRDCLSCHETRPEAPLLGVSPLNVSPQMAAALPFAAPVRGNTEGTLPGRTPEESAVMGYLIGNCAHCHNGLNHGGELGGMNATFSLRPEDMVANTVRQRTNSSASGAGIRVAPKQPSRSALYQAVVVAPRQSRPRFLKMPPLGVDTPDPSAARLLRAWIMKL